MLAVTSLMGQMPPAHAANQIGHLYIHGKEVDIDNVSSGPGWTYAKATNLLTLENFTSKAYFGGTGAAKAELRVHLKGTNTLTVGPGDKAVLNGSGGSSEKGAIKITADPGATLTINSQMDGSRGQRLIEAGSYVQLGGSVTINHKLPSSGMKKFIGMFHISDNNGRFELRNNAVLDVRAQTDGAKPLSGVSLSHSSIADLRTSKRFTITIDKPDWLSSLPTPSESAIAIYGRGSNYKTIVGGSGTYSFQTAFGRAIQGDISVADGQKLTEPERLDFVSGTLPSESKLRFAIPTHYRITLDCGSNGSCTKHPAQEKSSQHCCVVTHHC